MTAKKMTKAETARANLDRAIASANKAVEGLTLEDAMLQYAMGEISADGLRNVYATAMNNRFAYTLEDNGHHWSVIWRSDNAKHSGSNLRPTWEAIDKERQSLAAILSNPPKGKKPHSNPAQVWSRVRERAFEMAFPGQKRPPRQTSVPADAALKQMIAAYTKVAKQDIQTERDEEMVRVIGEALIALRVDLSKINEKIG